MLLACGFSVQGALKIGGDAPEFTDNPANGLGDIGQTFGPKHNETDQENDEEFRAKTAAQPYFCLTHFAGFVACAKERMSRRDFADFYKIVSEQEGAVLEELNNDVSWFVKKFDYRYEAEPWGNAKDAPERAIAFLNGRIHEEPRDAGKQQ